MWSSAPVDRSRALLEDLERFRSALVLLPLPEVRRAAPPAAIRIVGFGDPGGFDEFRKSPEASGFVLGTLKGPVVLFDASGKDASTALRHAFVHASLASSSADMPAWQEEGLAEYLAQLSIASDAVSFGAAPSHLSDSLRYGKLLPLRRVLGAGASRATWSAGEKKRFAAQSFALVHLLQSRAHGTLAEDYAALAETIERRGVQPDAEASDLAEPLQAQFTAYLRQEEFAELRIGAELPAVEPVQIRAAGADAALAVLGEIADELDAAEPLVARIQQRALASDPTRVFGAIEIALRDPDVPAAQIVAALDQLETKNPGDPVHWARIGDAWWAFEARHPDEAEGRAAAAYHRAIELDPTNVRATVGLAATFGDSFEDHAAAAMLLRRGATEAPGVASLELTLANRLAGAGQHRQAAAVLRRLARRPHLEAIVASERLTAALSRSGVELADLDGQLWEAQLLVRTPQRGAELEQLAPWLEVSGSAGLGEAPKHDVVVIFDFSLATLAPSGQDVNGNGVVGREAPVVDRVVSPFPSRSPISQAAPRILTTDRGDSILAAQRYVAADLASQLDPATTRVAALAYATKAMAIAPFGPPEVAATAIDEFASGVVAPNAAGIHHGLLAALSFLTTDEPPDPQRRTSILLVSGQPPGSPNFRRAKRQAVEMATILGQLGTPVHTFSVGRFGEKRVGSLLLAVSAASGGTHTPVLEVTEARLPNLDVRLAGLEVVEIRNTTTGADARAARVFADGSFDAIVPLTPGENQIDIVARLAGRAPLRETRMVRYVVPEEPTSAHRRRAAVLLWELRNRSIEVATRLQIAEAQSPNIPASDTAGDGLLAGEQRTELSIEVLPEPEAIAPSDVPGMSTGPSASDETGTDVAAPPLPSAN